MRKYLTISLCDLIALGIAPSTEAYTSKSALDSTHPRILPVWHLARLPKAPPASFLPCLLNLQRQSKLPTLDRSHLRLPTQRPSKIHRRLLTPKQTRRKRRRKTRQRLRLSSQSHVSNPSTRRRRRRRRKTRTMISLHWSRRQVYIALLLDCLRNWKQSISLPLPLYLRLWQPPLGTIQPLLHTPNSSPPQTTYVGGWTLIRKAGW